MMRITFALGLVLSVGRLAAADDPSYDRAVKPLLEMHCVSCHGAKKAKGGAVLFLGRSAPQGRRESVGLAPSPMKVTAKPCTLLLEGR